jgi:hypothetical protein
LAGERERLRGLRTLADIDLASPEGRIRGSQVLVVEPPKRLRIELLSTFGVVWILATDGQGFDVYSREDDTVYRGTLRPGLLPHYLPIPLALDELTELLLGRPPPRDVESVEAVAWEPETGLVRLELQLDGGGTQTVWFDGSTGLLRRCEERQAGGAVRFDLRITAYRDFGETAVGSALTIVAPHGVRVQLSYARSELNPAVPDDIFRLPHILGASEVDLDARANLP